MKDKMIESIANLNNTEIKPYLMCLYFNASLLKKVFFGCGLINLKDYQDKILRKLYETTIAKKLRLGSNFPRAALCSRKNALWIGLIKPKIEVAMLACKLCTLNVNKNSRRVFDNRAGTKAERKRNKDGETHNMVRRSEHDVE